MRWMVPWMVLVVWSAVASATHAQECAGGRVASEATDWHCCWPAQTWGAAERACIGPPRCPAGTAAHGETCSALEAIVPSGHAALAPMDAPSVAPSTATSSDVRAVPEGASEWASSALAPTGSANPRVAREPLDWDLVVAGTTLLGLGYATAIGTSVHAVQRTIYAYFPPPLNDPCWDVAGGLGFVPVLGAIVSLGVGSGLCFDPGVHAVLMSLSTVLQGTGLGLLVAGLLGEHRVLQLEGEVRATLVPGAVNADVGMTVLGAF